MSNNKVKDWVEIDRLGALDKLEDLLLVGNPLYNDFRDNNATAEYRVEVRKSGESRHGGCWHTAVDQHVQYQLQIPVK